MAQHDAARQNQRTMGHNRVGIVYLQHAHLRLLQVSWGPHKAQIDHLKAINWCTLLSSVSCFHVFSRITIILTRAAVCSDMLVKGFYLHRLGYGLKQLQQATDSWPG